MEMKKYKLDELATVEISGVDKKTKEDEIPIKLCNFTDVYHNWAITKELSNSFMTASANQKEIGSFSLKKGQVAFTKDSETRDDIGIPTYIADDFDNVVLGYHTALITPNKKKLSGKYLNAFMNTKYIQKYFENNATGSGQRYSLSNETLNSIPIILPDLETQEKIGVIFSNIDRKIALNRRINVKLETMTKRLYDYWFVQFDFPNADGKPYKSSGGKMEYNETLKREIPAGWTNCSFGEYVERITNGLNPRKNFVLGNGSNYYVTIRSLLEGDIDWNNCDKCDDEALEKINSRSQLKVGDFIFSAIGTIGRTYRIYETPKNWNISETSFTIRPKNEVPSDFFYALLKSNELQNQANRKAMGSTLRCLVMDTMCEIPCIKVDLNIAKNFSKVVQPLFLNIYENNKENRKLTAMRDRLLPLLMNGQVEVK